MYSGLLFNNLPAQHRSKKDWLIDVNPNLVGPPKTVAELFAEVTRALDTIPDSDQKEEGMQKLIEAKDCFVRSVVR